MTKFLLPIFIAAALLAGGGYYAVKDLPLVQQVIGIRAPAAPGDTVHKIAASIAKFKSGYKPVDVTILKQYFEEAIREKYDIIVKLDPPVGEGEEGFTLGAYITVKQMELMSYFQKAYDHNGNGVVDPTEWPTESSEMFLLATADANADRTVTFDEFWETDRLSVSRRYKRMDSDGSGRLSYDEFYKGGSVTAAIRAIDKNTNGALDPHEAKQMADIEFTGWTAKPF